VSSLITFNVYAQQQGGPATGGAGQFNQGTGMTITCTVNNACVITGSSAIGGSSTGGNANTNLSKQKELMSPINQNNKSTNKAPIADAGSSQEVNEGDIVLLNGSKSFHPDGDPITYSWRQIAGPAVKLEDATSALPSFATSSSIQSETKLGFELTVKDNEDKSTSFVTVTVKPPINNTITAPTTPNIQNTLLDGAGNGSGTVNQPPAGYLTYTNPNYGITLNYKSDWIKEEGSGSTGESECNGCNDIATLRPSSFENEDYFPLVVTVSSYPYSSPHSISEVLDNSISSAKSLKHFKLTTSNASITLAGYPAYEFEYNYDFKSNKKTIPRSGFETGIIVGNTNYFIEYQVDTDKYSTYLPIVQNMIKSFKITNPQK